MLASFTFLLLSSNWSTCDILKRERDGSVIVAWKLKGEILYFPILGKMNYKGTEHKDGFIVYWCLCHTETNFSENTWIWKPCVEFVLLACISSSECRCLSFHLRFFSWWEVKRLLHTVFLKLNSQNILPTVFKELTFLARESLAAEQNSCNKLLLSDFCFILFWVFKWIKSR